MRKLPIDDTIPHTRAITAKRQKQERWNNINWNTPAQKLEAVQYLHNLSKEERDAMLRDEATKVAPGT